MSSAAALIGREEAHEKKLPKYSTDPSSSTSASSSAETLSSSLASSVGSSVSSLSFNVSNRRQKSLRLTAGNGSASRGMSGHGAKSAMYKEPPRLAKTFSCASAMPSSKNPPMLVRNQLAEQDNNRMNQTFTFGSRLVAPRQPPGRGRSSSIDSDFGDYTIQGALTGLFPRNIGGGIKSSLSNHLGRKAFSKSSGQTSAADTCKLAQNLTAAATLWTKCAKLPSLEGCSADRKCCQKQFASTRTQYELAKYKDTLKNN